MISPRYVECLSSIFILLLYRGQKQRGYSFPSTHIHSVYFQITMKEEISDENLDRDDDDDYHQSSIKYSQTTPTVPFATFYMTKGTPSTSQQKLSEQLANTSSKTVFFLRKRKYFIFG